MRASEQRTLIDLLSLPTAPLCEQHVIAFIKAWAARRPAVRCTHDVHGNFLLHVRRGRPAREPLVLMAHMDHPGFEADRMIRRGRLRAWWRGWVAPEYFAGAGVRFFVNDRWIHGRVRSVTTFMDRGRRRVRHAIIETGYDVPPGAIGMWDFPDPIIRNERVYARACDDVAGVAGMLCTMDRLARGKGPVDAYALCSRAEELNFIGAMAAAQNGLIPAKARIISIETSSEIPGVRMGDGPILRVGDNTSVFDSALTSLCRQVATELEHRRPRFRFQRKLMDGGTCEASAMQSFGHMATGICLALGNYHNMDSRRRRLGPEYIHVADFQRMVDWFEALATSRLTAGDRERSLRDRLAGFRRRWNPLLRRTARRALSLVPPPAQRRTRGRTATS